MSSLLNVRAVVTAQDAFENAWADVVACSCRANPVLESPVRRRESFEGIFGPVRTSGDVVVGAIGILYGEAVDLFCSVVDAVFRLYDVSKRKGISLELWSCHRDARSTHLRDYCRRVHLNALRSKVELVAVVVEES